MNKSSAINNLNIFLVGGAVRDQLLNRTVTERDYLVVGATPEEMLKLGFTAVGKDFPVFLHPETKEEYALARTEKKAGKGYTGFECYAAPDVTIEQDLLRRDLTINAMAMDKNGNIIDPYNGQKDLKNKIFRHVSDAFLEDPLRVLRVARFAARYHQYGFKVADETMLLMKNISQQGELNTLSAERLFKEMQRSLNEPNPEIFFLVLKECGALAELLPELNKLWGIPAPEKWHPEICTGIHTMLALQQAVKLTNNTAVRFATLLHDLGKGLTAEEYLPSHHGHEKSGLPLVAAVCERFKVPSEYKKLALLVCQYHLHCHQAFQLKPTTILALFNHLDIWRNDNILNEFLTACAADLRGRTGFENNPYPQQKFLLALANETKKINAAPIIAKGYQGKAIKEQMEQERIKVIKAFKLTRLEEFQNSAPI